MPSQNRPLLQTLACWNWKCALLSTVARSLVYLEAMARSASHSRLAMIAVELAYVTMTAGVYAGMQQRALGLRSRFLGNLTIAVGVPALAQSLDWLIHRSVGGAAPPRATLAVSIFALVSALFHLHVMRRGVFLTGRSGRKLADDLRDIPGLVLDFVLRPFRLGTAVSRRLPRAAETEAAL